MLGWLSWMIQTRDGAGMKRHRRVQDNAEQQGIAPDRVESVQPLRFCSTFAMGAPATKRRTNRIDRCNLPDRADPFLPDPRIRLADFSIRLADPRESSFAGLTAIRPGRRAGIRSASSPYRP